MGTYEDLKAAIQQVIRTNGNNEITGKLLQQTLLSIVNSVGANAAFAGIATPNTNPGTADQNVFYLATEPGTYVNFGGIEITEGEAVILSNKTGNWTKTTSGFATQQQLTELESKLIIEDTSNYEIELVQEHAFIDVNGNIISNPASFSIYRLSGNIVTQKKNIYVRLHSYIGGNSYVAYLYNSTNELVNKIGYIPSLIRNIFLNIDLTFGYDDIAYILLNATKEPTIYIDKNLGQNEKTKVEQGLEKVEQDIVDINNSKNFLKLYRPATSEEYDITLYESGKFYHNGNFIDNPDFCVYKLSLLENINKTKRNIGLFKCKVIGQGIYIAFVFDSRDRELQRIGYVDNDIIKLNAYNDIVLPLRNIGGASYVLFNYQINEELPTVTIETFDNVTNIAPASYVTTNDYDFTLFAENKLIMPDGSISEADYDGFNVYKLTGGVITQKKKILLNEVYNTGLGLWLVCMYDSNDNLIDRTGWMHEDNGIYRGYNDIVVDLSFSPIYKDVAYILICVSYNRLPNVYIGRSGNNAQQYSGVLGKMFAELGVGKTIIVNKNGNIGVDCDYNKVKDAIDYANNNPNTTILIASGTYDIIEEFGEEYMESIAEDDNNYQGLILGNNVRIIGQGYGVKLIANYQGSNDFAKAKFSIFNIKSDFYIENLELEVTNVRYCVHEDNPLGRNNYNGIYRNIKMTHNGTNGISYTAVCCLGAGCVGNTITTIDGCEFNNNWENPTNPVSYHNNSVAGEVAQVIVKNCYFHNKQTFQTWVMVANGSTIKCFLCNNKFGANPLHSANNGLVKVIDFNNTIQVTDD